MKRTAGEYAILLGLLDEALDLPEEARARWVEQLGEPFAELRPTLRRLLETQSARETSDFELAGQIAALAHDAATAADIKPLAPGDHIGPYELSRELGQGGMGSVWLASRVDGAFKRVVALKLPHVTWAGGLAERMARERDILAGLEHPYIARLYDAGVDALGRPFLALEYIEGRAIDVYCRDERLSLRDRLALLLNVAKAVAYAHSKLVVHRDLKPSNILVTAQGDARLLDFGIAKLIDSDHGHDARPTQFAGRLLTPDYASPEQIKGESVGTPTDVYSLAVVAYELLTGTRPYRLKRDTPAELEQAIAEIDPLPASEAAVDEARKRELRGDLDAILNKALKKDPAQRYPTIDAFASDITRYLGGETVQARPDRAVYKLRKLIGRNRLAFGAAGAVMLALIAATTFSLLQAREANHQAETANVIKDFLMDVIAAGDNRTTGSKAPADMTALELIDKSRAEALNSMSTRPAVKLELLQFIGGIYERMDSVDKALDVYRSGVSFAQANYGPHSAEKADMLARVASVLVFGGRFAESEPAIDAAEKEFDAIGMHDSLLYVQLLKLKGNVLRRKGPGSALLARSTLQKAAALFKKKFPDSDGYVGTLMFLASVEQSLDEMPDALKTADTAVDVARKSPTDANGIANALSLRASVKDEVGDFNGAQHDYLESSQLYANSIGIKNFLYLQNENFRGQSLHLSGRRDAGIELLESTTAQIGVVRPGSNTQANSLNRLADAYLRDGAFAQALQDIEQALAIPFTHQSLPLYTHLLLSQAQALTGLGRFSEATAKVNEALQALSADGPPSPYMTAEMHLSLGDVALSQGDFTESGRHLSLAGNASIGDTRRVRRQRARIHGMTARLATARHEPVVAATAAVSARQLTEAPDIKDDLFVRAEVLTALGEALCSQAASDEGTHAASEALATRTAILRTGSPYVAESQIHLARCLFNAGQIDQAKPLIASAQQVIDEHGLGPQFETALQSVKTQFH